MSDTDTITIRGGTGRSIILIDGDTVFYHENNELQFVTVRVELNGFTLIFDDGNELVFLLMKRST